MWRALADADAPEEVTVYVDEAGMTSDISILALSSNYLAPTVTGLAISVMASQLLKRFPTVLHSATRADLFMSLLNLRTYIMGVIITMASKLMKESTELSVSPPWDLKKRHKENRPRGGLFIMLDLLVSCMKSASWGLMFFPSCLMELSCTNLFLSVFTSRPANEISR